MRFIILAALGFILLGKAWACTDWKAVAIADAALVEADRAELKQLDETSKQFYAEPFPAPWPKLDGTLTQQEVIKKMKEAKESDDLHWKVSGWINDAIGKGKKKLDADTAAMRKDRALAKVDRCRP